MGKCRDKEPGDRNRRQQDERIGGKNGFSLNPDYWLVAPAFNFRILSTTGG